MASFEDGGIESFGPDISPVIFVGPTLVGKSLMVREMAAAAGAEIITSDKYYLYAGRDFLLGIGMTPSDLEGKPHLVGSLAPEAPLPTTDEYVEMAATKVDEIHARGRPAFIEGCSFSYTMGLMRRYHEARVFRCSSLRYMQQLPHRTVVAYDMLVDLGLYDETAEGLKKGYEGTFPMSSIIYRAVIEAVHGRIDPQEARWRTVKSWIATAGLTEFKLQTVPEIRLLNAPMGSLRGKPIS